MAPPVLPRDVKERPGDTSANETLVDLFMERAIDLLRLEAGTRDQVVKFLHVLESDTVAVLAKANLSGEANAANQRNRLGELLKVVQGSIKATYRGISVLMAREIRDIIDVEATWTASAINAAVRAEFADAGLTRSLLSTLVSDVFIQGAASKDWWGRQAGGLAERFSDEMRRGMALGESNGALIERVRGPQGIMKVSRTSAERLVRASVQAAANTARESTYDQNTDLISALEWSATLDTRTSPWCYVRDGLKYTPKDHRPMGHTVPWLEGPGKLHWGCRSTSVPVLKSWHELGINIEEIPETTRASMDGQVPAQMTFEQWLRKQSVERQDTVLGNDKAQLWRDGKIAFRDLLDQNGRPLTTAELRAKAAQR